jgi:hypothetical protein
MYELQKIYLTEPVSLIYTRPCPQTCGAHWFVAFTMAQPFLKKNYVPTDWIRTYIQLQCI